MENSQTRDPASSEKVLPSKVLESNIEALKKRSDYEKIPLTIREDIEENRDGIGATLQAAEKFLQLERAREQARLSQADIELLADAENPYRLKNFSKEDKLRLAEIKRKIAASQTRS